MDGSGGCSSGSLFPAYATASNKNNKEASDPKQQEWLTNASFSTEAYRSLPQNKSSFLPDDKSSPSISSDESSDSYAYSEPVRKDIKQEVQNVKQNPESILIQEGAFLKNHLKNVIFLEDTGLSDERAFRIDRKYDAENLAFGALDRKTLPRYQCILGPFLGCSKKEIEEWLQSKKKRKKISRYFGKKLSKNLQGDFVEVCVPSCIKERDSSVLPEYLSLSLSSKNENRQAGGMPAFDGISVNWKSHQNEPPIKLIDTADHQEVDRNLQERIRYFNKSVTESVHDEQLWIDFVDFQRELFQSPAFSKSGLVNEKALVEKQIAILDKALEQNPNSVKLSVTKLKLLRNLVEKEELFSKWEKFLFYFPHDSSVWQQYLDFVLTDVSYFSVSLISKLYQKCLATLKRVVEGELRSHTPTPWLPFNILDVFCSACTVLLNCGHQETAISLFQALLEFSAFPPPYVIDVDSTNQQIALFEPYWDSGVPRVGEKGSLGWCRTVLDKKITINVEASVIDLSEAEDRILQTSASKPQTWLEFEVLRGMNHFLPWRPDVQSGQTNDDLDDPDRIVTFDQVSGFLFRPKDGREQFYLLCHFLRFLGVNLHSLSCPSYSGGQDTDHYNTEDFNPLLEQVKNIFSENIIPEELELKTYRNQEAYSSFIDNIFEQVIDMFNDEYRTYISFLWLKYVIAKEPADCYRNKKSGKFAGLKKFSKNLLKKQENRNCLFLWSEFIQIEWLDAGREKATQTFQTLLMSSSASSSFSSGECRAVWYFVRRFIELCINNEDCYSTDGVFLANDILLWVLSRVMGKQSYTLFDGCQNVNPAQLMKALSDGRKSLCRELESVQENEDDNVFCKCMKPLSKPLLDCLLCVAYLCYLTKGIDAGINQFSDILSQLKEASTKSPSLDIRHTLEQITVFQAELWNFHLRRTQKSLHPLQTFLYKAVEDFPCNAQLLVMLLKIKSVTPIIGTTHRFFYKLIKSGKKLSSISWLFAIISELIICYRHQEPLTCSVENPEGLAPIKNCGLVWKVRSLFDAALKHPGSEHSIALWRCYMKFEVSNGESSRAKSVLYQALQSCPWAKAIYLDGIGYFPEEFDQLISVMNEKELRIHTPPEEVDLLMQHALKATEQQQD